MLEQRLDLVFETMQRNNVRCLLMGGQACVLYGAAEFSKDVDLVVLASPENLARLEAAMAELAASIIAVPPFDAELLNAGLAVHFRCHAPGLEGLRVDVMTTMRGVSSFPELWERRVSLAYAKGEINLLSIPDLVAAKKTQRAKDWPMIQRLVEVAYLSASPKPTVEQTQFWLRELRSAELLIEATQRFSAEAEALFPYRSLLKAACACDHDALERGLMEEMLAEQARDRKHWEPLKSRINALRRQAVQDSKTSKPNEN